MTFYLKYRPQTVSELDLDKVRESLEKIIKSENIPHAFLFSGPKGAGKTSTARILAKAVNCLNPQKNGEPCNTCQQCLSINRGSSLDVIEVDAASHRGVDDIRTLRETVKLAPAGSKKKVYIIDEAHMLTTEAANALLKTLEEPPAHALFVLATTAPEKLPDTIRSRSTNVNFYKGSPQELIKSLEKVVKGEKIEIEDEALQLIVAKSDGSFREAHKLLEQVSLGCKKVTKETAVKIISGGVSNPQEFLNFLKNGRAKEALDEIEKLVQNGVNLRSFVVEAITQLRQEMLEQVSTGKAAESFKLIELLSEAYRQIPTAVLPQLPVEMVVAKWGMVELVSSHSSSNSAPAESGTGAQSLRAKQVSDSNSFAPASNNDEHHSKAHNSPLKEEEEEKEVKAGGLNEDEKVVETAGSESLMQVPAPIGEELEDKWKEIMRATKNKNHSVEALLRACRPAGFDGRSLSVEVFYKFHKDKLETAGYRTIVEDAASEVLSARPIRLVCILSQTKKRASDIVNVTVPNEDEVVKLAEEIFGATSDGKIH